MEAVGHHLQIQALSMHRNGEESDIFARSAYNRYYYATFLIVRKCVSQLDSSWERLPHKSYPPLLETKILNKFAKSRQRAVKIGDTKLVRGCQNAQNAIKSLAKLMQESSAIRVIADYEPDININFSSAERFNLGGVDITSAHQWPVQARAYTQVITSTWRQLGV